MHTNAYIIVAFDRTQTLFELSSLPFAISVLVHAR